MDEEEGKGLGGPLRVGLWWGGIGGVIGFAVCLIGSLAGVVVSGFIGWACGRRAAESFKERQTGAGALAGMVAGFVAAPVYTIGASVGAIVSARALGMESIASRLGGFLNTEVSAAEAWQLFLFSLIFAAMMELGILTSASTIAGALLARKRTAGHETEDGDG